MNKPLEVPDTKIGNHLDIGSKWGSWTVIDGPHFRLTAYSKKKERVWKCRCDCGTIMLHVATRLVKGTTTRCRFCGNKAGTRNLVKDISGQTFGNILVLRQGPSVKRKVMWLCRCVCGKEWMVGGYHLRCGATQSCGCINKERLKNRRKGSNLDASLERWIRLYINGAERRSYEWALTDDQFKTLVLSPCTYCGIFPKNAYRLPIGTLYEGLNGIDRVNNFLGYTIDNCVPSCGECNFAKSKKNLDTFLNWVKRVSIHSLGASYSTE